MHITLTQLRYAVAVADAGSISEAAQRCFISQPALSTALKQLESQLGAQLFERGRHGARLTTMGDSLVRQARRVLGEVSRLEELAEAMGDPMHGRLRLGVIATVAPYLLPRVLPKVQRTYPSLELELCEGLTEGLLQDLNDHRIDAALIALPYDIGPLTVLPLFHEPFKVLCRDDHPLVTQTPLVTDALGAEGMLLLEEGHCLRDHALLACQRAGAAQHLRATSLETLRGLISAGMGYSLFPALALDQARLHAPLRVLPLQDPPGRDICFVARPTSARLETLERLGETISRLILQQLPQDRLPSR